MVQREDDADDDGIADRVDMRFAIKLDALSLKLRGLFGYHPVNRGGQLGTQ